MLGLTRGLAALFHMLMLCLFETIAPRLSVSIKTDLQASQTVTTSRVTSDKAARMGGTCRGVNLQDGAIRLRIIRECKDRTMVAGQLLGTCQLAMLLPLAIAMDRLPVPPTLLLLSSRVQAGR